MCEELAVANAPAGIKGVRRAVAGVLEDDARHQRPPAAPPPPPPPGAAAAQTRRRRGKGAWPCAAAESSSWSACVASRSERVPRGRSQPHRCPRSRAARSRGASSARGPTGLRGCGGALQAGGRSTARSRPAARRQHHVCVVVGRGVVRAVHVVVARAAGLRTRAGRGEGQVSGPRPPPPGPPPHLRSTSRRTSGYTA